MYILHVYIYYFYIIFSHLYVCNVHVFYSEFIFSCVGANLNTCDQDGFTALHHAASSGHLYAVQLLLDLGASKNFTNRYSVLYSLWTIIM